MKQKILGYIMCFGSFWLFCWLMSIMPEEWFGSFTPWWLLPLFITELMVCTRLGIIGIVLITMPPKRKSNL